MNAIGWFVYEADQAYQRADAEDAKVAPLARKRIAKQREPQRCWRSPDGPIPSGIGSVRVVVHFAPL